MRWFTRLIYLVSGVAFAAVAAGWLLLYSTTFNNLRADLVERTLSERNGFEIVIDGDVQISLGRISKVFASDAHIPSDTIDDVNLLELESASFQFDTLEFLRGRQDIEAINVVGLNLYFLRTEDDRISWANDTREQRISDAKTNGDVATDAARAIDRFFLIKRLMNALIERSDAHKQITIVFEDRRTGFNFKYELEETTFLRSENNQRLELKSVGTLNDVPFELVADHHSNGPFSTKGTFPGFTLSFDGVNDPGWDAGYSGVLDLEIGRIGEFLDILGLDRTFEGSGAFSVRLDNDGQSTSASEISSFVEIDGGIRGEIDGFVSNLEEFGGVNLTTFLRLHPEGKAPPTAERVSELRLVDFSAKLVGDKNGVVVEDARVGTNAFDEDFESFGPMSVQAVRRTQNGTLTLDGIRLQIGPADAPFLSVTGDVADTLRFKDFAFNGAIFSPARRLLADLGKDVARQFGRLEGAFNVSDEAGYAKLNDFSLKLIDTDLWDLEVSADSVGFADAFDFEIDASLGVADSKRFLSALSLKEIDFSPFASEFKTSVTEQGLAVRFDVTSGSSLLTTQFDVDVSEEQTSVTGAMRSEEIALQDLGNLVAGVSELSKLNLVLRDMPSDQEDEFQPLVIDEREPTLQDVLEEEGMQPLVLPVEDATASDFFDPDHLLKRTDLDIEIDIAKLSGTKGVSKINSRLVSKNGKARFGPLDVSLGNGYAMLIAAMDVFETPNVMTVSGSIGGWDLGDVMQTLGISLEADGAIGGDFNLSGRNDSVRSFVESMRGPVNLNISDGTIATSLLELAGLGVIPWLFSDERRNRQTYISCLIAPLELRAGRISFDRFVAETRSVQVVASGLVDWKNDSIEVRAEPRPLGKPLARSAWPVKVSGKLNSPDIEAQAGRTRQRRADGATTMPQTRKPCVPDIYQLEN